MKKILYYEGIRGIAAFWVVIIHFFAAFYWIDSSGFKQISRVLLDGELPVYIFWLLSALVILKGYTGFSENKTNWMKIIAKFSVKRYLRLIIPVFISSLLIYILLINNGFYFKQLINKTGFYGNSSWLGRFYNFQPEFLPFLKITFLDVLLIDNCNYNMVLWTLPMEFFGPVFIIIMDLLLNDRHYKNLVLLFLALLFFILGLSFVKFNYYLLFIIGLIIHNNETLVYADQKIFMNLNSIVHSLVNSFMFSLVIMTISFVLLIVDSEKNSLMFLNNPLRAISIILMVRNSLLIQKFLSNRFFVFLGKISFSWYLLHVPLLFTFVSYLYMHNELLFGKHLILLAAIYLIISMILAYLFYELVDKTSNNFVKSLFKTNISQNN